MDTTKEKKTAMFNDIAEYMLICQQKLVIRPKSREEWLKFLIDIENEFNSIEGLLESMDIKEMKVSIMLLQQLKIKLAEQQLEAFNALSLIK